MAPVSKSFARQRAERRIEVHLPMRVRGRDALGVAFEEDTSSENLCRSGAAFLTRFDVAIGSDLEIRIPFSNYASRRGDADFSTNGRVVHVRDAASSGEKLVGGAVYRPAVPARIPLRICRLSLYACGALRAPRRELILAGTVKSRGHPRAIPG